MNRKQGLLVVILLIMLSAHLYRNGYLGGIGK